MSPRNITRRRLRPRDTLPVIDDSDNGAWWRGWWTGAPVWMSIGAGFGVMLLKHFAR